MGYHLLVLLPAIREMENPEGFKEILRSEIHLGGVSKRLGYGKDEVLGGDV